MMSKPVQQLQLTLFECGRPLKRARRDSESASTDSTPPTQFTLQPSSQVCNTTEHMCMMTEPAVSSASSFAAYSSPHSCPTPEFINRSSDEESVISVAELSGGSDTALSPALSTHSSTTVSISSTTISISATAMSTSSTSTILNPATIVNVTSVPGDIAQSATSPPVRPTNIKFPATKFGCTTRTFNIAWYDRFGWLEYSVQRNACFCYPCRMFESTSSFG